MSAFMDVNAYLARIDYSGPIRQNLVTLTALHRAHLRAIPYENLDVQLGFAVRMEPAAIFEKIVTNRRGGWCYEMNGLFGWALAEIGFDVTRSAGAVMREARGNEVAGNHLVLKVELDEGVFLADVGFGDGPLDPIRVVEGPFTSNGFDFALSRQPEGWWRLHNHPGGGAPSFDFDMSAADEALLARKCAWLQSSPESAFVQNAVVQRHFPQGIRVMRGRVFRELTAEGKKDQLVNSASEYVEILADVFGLRLPEAASLWPKICTRHEALLAGQSAPSD